MKIRTGFVTNSSSSNFVIISVNDSTLDPKKPKDENGYTIIYSDDYSSDTSEGLLEICNFEFSMECFENGETDNEDCETLPDTLFAAFNEVVSSKKERTAAFKKGFIMKIAEGFEGSWENGLVVKWDGTELSLLYGDHHGIPFGQPYAEELTKNDRMYSLVKLLTWKKQGSQWIESK